MASDLGPTAKLMIGYGDRIAKLEAENERLRELGSDLMAFGNLEKTARYQRRARELLALCLSMNVRQKGPSDG